MSITCNSTPLLRFEDDLDAWKRRLLIVKYARQAPARKIPGYAEQLLAEEGPGILLWILKGATHLLEDLKTIGDYRLTDTQHSRIEDLLKQSDSVRFFVEDCVSPVENADVTVNELLDAYDLYCQNKGWEPLASRNLSTQIVDMMKRTHKVVLRKDIDRELKDQRGFMHVALAPDMLPSDHSDRPLYTHDHRAPWRTTS